jgi:hypothetical protein
MSHFFPGLAFYIAQDDDYPVPGGEPAHLLVEYRSEVDPRISFQHFRLGHNGHLLFPLSLPGDPGPCLECRLVGDAVEPVGDHLFGYDGSGLADEDEEGGLEGIFGIMVIDEDATAHAPDHRAVPPHQGRKRGLLSAAEVGLQQLPVGQSGPIPPQHGPAKILQGLAHPAGLHVSSSVAYMPSPYSYYYRLERDLIPLFRLV